MLIIEKKWYMLSKISLVSFLSKSPMEGLDDATLDAETGNFKFLIFSNIFTTLDTWQSKKLAMQQWIV